MQVGVDNKEVGRGVTIPGPPPTEPQLTSPTSLNCRIEHTFEINMAQSLPRFLLPRLSWTGSPLGVTSTASRVSASFVQHHAKNQRIPPWEAQGRSLHTSPNRRPVRSHCLTTTPAPSLSRIARDPSLRRPFHASAPLQRDHHFDTLKFVQRLEEEGFTEDQAVAMMKVLNDVIEER